MRYLGIDYGAKRVGVALSDEGGTLAFPREVLSNDKNLVSKLGQIVRTESVAEIVIGESLNYSGSANAIVVEVEEFISKIETEFKIPIHKEKEFLTTVEARRYHENGKKVDASAAALILQRYLDKINNK